jgi:hypothetical protein
MGPLLPATAPATAMAATSALPHHLPAATWTIHIICCWCHHCRQLRKQQGPQRLDDKYVLAMLLVLHKARGAASEWAPYINSLPDRYGESGHRAACCLLLQPTWQRAAPPCLPRLATGWCHLPAMCCKHKLKTGMEFPLHHVLTYSCSDVISTGDAEPARSLLPGSCSACAFTTALPLSPSALLLLSSR